MEGYDDFKEIGILGFDLYNWNNDYMGIPRDYAESFFFLSLASDKTNWSSINFLLGECYLRGQGTTADSTKAMTFFSKAAGVPADGEYDQFRQLGLFMVGVGYMTGDGLAKDINKAGEEFRSADAPQNADVELRIGQSLIAAGDYQNAQLWLRLSASKQTSAATAPLGTC